VVLGFNGDELLEVFKDIEIIVKGKSQHSRYEAEYLLAPAPNPKRITVEDLEQYVKRLSERYPQEGFKLEQRGPFYVISKKVILPRGEERKRLEDLHEDLARETRLLGFMEGELNNNIRNLMDLENQLAKLERPGIIGLILKLIKRGQIKRLKGEIEIKNKEIKELEQKIEAQREAVKKIKGQIEELEDKIGRCEKGIEIYFDLESQKVYIPRFYWEKERKLASYLLMVTLGALGIARQKYLRIVGRSSKNA